MRVVLASLAAVALSFAAHPVLACGSEASFPNDDPVVVRPQSVSTNASDLLSEARRLEVRAASLDTLASERTRRADEQTVDARALRIEAASTEGRDRAQLFAAADSLENEAVQSRREARLFRTQAASLRAQAQLDRNRAVQLVSIRNGNGNGWHRDRVAPPPPRSAVDL